MQEKFQASYEAWHFYYQRPTKHIAEQTAQIYEPQARQAVSFRLGFTAENADQLAVCVGLIDEQGNYVGMPGVAAGRLYGFYWALRNKKKVNGSLELLRDYFALRYLKKLIPSKPNGNSNVAQDMIADTDIDGTGQFLTQLQDNMIGKIKTWSANEGASGKFEEFVAALRQRKKDIK